MSDGTGVGDRLREIRKRRGMTQRDLARASRVSLSLVRKVEQGDDARTGAVALRKLATALDVPVTALLGFAPAVRPAPVNGEMWKPLAMMLSEPTGAQEPEQATDVASALTSATRLYHANKYSELAALLPGLVRDASSCLARIAVAGLSACRVGVNAGAAAGSGADRA